MDRIAAGMLSASGRENVIRKAEDLVREHAGLECVVRLGQDDGDGYEIQGVSGTLGRLEIRGAEPDRQQRLIRVILRSWDWRGSGKPLRTASDPA
jgi:hypothetical protein